MKPAGLARALSAHLHGRVHQALLQLSGRGHEHVVPATQERGPVSVVARVIPAAHGQGGWCCACPCPLPLLHTLLPLAGCLHAGGGTVSHMVGQCGWRG